MKKIISAVLLVLAFLMYTGGVFEIEGMLSMVPSLAWAIILSAVAQLTVHASGSIASPKRGKVGFFRSAAFVFLIPQSAQLPVGLFALLYERIARAKMLDTNASIWSISIGMSAALLVLASVKNWDVSPRKKVEGDGEAPLNGCP